jgi:hypothetical protein
VLEPCAAPPARLVGSVESLGNDAFELVCASDREHCVELARERRGDPPASAGRRHRPTEQLRATVVWQPPHRPAIEMQQVEDDQRHGVPRRELHGRATGARGQSATESMEVRSAITVETDQLAVDHDVVSGERVGDRGNFRELVCAVPPWPRSQAPITAAGDAQLSAHTVPFELKRPVLALPGRRNSRTQEHRLDKAGKGLALDGRPWHALEAYAATVLAGMRTYVR